MTQSMLTEQRRLFLTSLVTELLSVDATGIPNIADRSSEGSKGIARAAIERLLELGSAPVRTKEVGQVVGRKFEELVATFLRATFPRLTVLRPGHWRVDSTVTEIQNFEPFRLLANLIKLRSNKTLMDDPALREAAFGDQYLIRPDVVVTRRPEPDEVINKTAMLVDLQSGLRSPMREANHIANHVPSILHACVSCKFTIRSDRAQNVRSEAISLLRFRRGHAPHIVAVTCEPLPSRIASIARGTGEIDCVYHAFLPELLAGAREYCQGGLSEQIEELDYLVQADRLRDIADLPLDLAM